MLLSHGSCSTCIQVSSDDKHRRLEVKVITVDSSRNMFGLIHLRAVVGNSAYMGTCGVLRILLAPALKASLFLLKCEQGLKLTSASSR